MSVCLQNIALSLEDRDAEELVLVLAGYHRLLSAVGGRAAPQQELEVVRHRSEFTEELGKSMNYYHAGILKTLRPPIMDYIHDQDPI